MMTKEQVEEILATQISKQFLAGMVARMEMSFFKYGDIKDAFPHKINALASLQQRLDKYKMTGNTEFLMDAANFAMIEFMLPRHANAHFTPTDSDQSPGRTNIYNYISDKPNLEKYNYTKTGD